jgi:hypothetical protein
MDVQVVLKPLSEHQIFDQLVLGLSQSVLTDFKEYDLYRFTLVDRYSGLRALRDRLLNIYTIERFAQEFNRQHHPVVLNANTGRMIHNP